MKMTMGENVDEKNINVEALQKISAYRCYKKYQSRNVTKKYQGTGITTK